MGQFDGGEKKLTCMFPIKNEKRTSPEIEMKTAKQFSHMYVLVLRFCPSELNQETHQKEGRCKKQLVVLCSFVHDRRFVALLNVISQYLRFWRPHQKQ